MNFPSLAFFGRTLRKPKRLPRIQRMGLKDYVWKEYLNAIKTEIISPWLSAIAKRIIDNLPIIQSHYTAERPEWMKNDAWSDDVGIHLDLLADDFSKLEQQSHRVAAGAFDAVNGMSHREWYVIAKRVLGVDLFKFEPWIRDEAKVFVSDNVALITKAGGDTLHDVRRVVMSGFKEGKRWETMREEIVNGTDLVPGVFQKVETRAELIARDQCTKLYGDLNGKRQRNSGITLYIWRTMEDERVVGNPSGKYPQGSPQHHKHYLMNGKVCKWSDPTVYADSVRDALDDKWKKRTVDMPKVHPGVEMQDRCYGEAVFEILFQ
jgi:hypothetical protein